jgi:threonine/homoserine/homoserine lactone efflux protein
MEWTTQHTAAAGLIAAAAFTPGPNNFIVMQRAAAAGLRAAAPAIAGVIAGSIALLALVAVGGGALFAAVPGLRLAVTLAGAAALAAAGVRLILRRVDAPRAASPAGFTALVAFQLLNPKAWTMALTAVAAVPPGGGAALLAPIFVVIPAAGLTLWGALGRVLAGRAWLDPLMGVLLVASAALLVVP